MSASLSLLTIFATAVVAAVLPTPGSVPALQPESVSSKSSSSSNLPLLLWHGLGDSFDSDGIKSVGALYQKIYPDSPVYFVHLGDDAGSDRHASFFGNLTEQVNQVCDDIRDTKELSHATAANALGFSQGGVFIRGLIERCDAINVRNLVTFGSPHSGITEFATCAEDDWWCKIWSGTLKGNTWSPFAQSTLVPAQYFRTSEDMENFLLYSNFLADVNNERDKKINTYRQRIGALSRFVMYKFQDEDVIHPPESSWFADSNTTSGLLTRLKERNLYTEDWLGLKKLDEAGGLEFRTTPGKHMQIGDGALEDAFRRYFAPTKAEETSNFLHTAQERAGQAAQAVLGSSQEAVGVLREADESRLLEPAVDEGATSGEVFLHRYAEELLNTSE